MLKIEIFFKQVSAINCRDFSGGLNGCSIELKKLGEQKF